MSLEVVRRAREEGVSLQRLRELEQALIELHPDAVRPFAYNLFFADGATLWVQLGGESDSNVVEAVGKRSNQFVWVPGRLIVSLEDSVRSGGILRRHEDRHPIGEHQGWVHRVGTECRWYARRS